MGIVGADVPAKLTGNRGDGDMVNLRGRAKMAESKAKKSAAELTELILDEVRSRPECRGLSGVSVTTAVASDGPSWYVHLRTGDPDKPTECETAINAVVTELRAQYDVAL
jgi:hypothetical protein